jgi:hypothetical protein
MIDEPGPGIALLLQGVHPGARDRRQRRFAAVEKCRQQQEHGDGRQNQGNIERHGFL